MAGYPYEIGGPSKVYSLHFCRSALGGLPQKSCFRQCSAPRSFYYLEKRDAAASPNRRAPQAPSVRVRALASRVADELRGRLALAVSRGAYPCNMSGRVLWHPNPLAAAHTGG